MSFLDLFDPSNGPEFFWQVISVPPCITGDLNLLQEKVMPAIQNRCPQDIIFQQDGASPHYARQVREFLDDVFPDAWIGRRGSIEWPARYDST
jgi:hypothetical protein